jgi:hypothetical protein
MGGLFLWSRSAAAFENSSVCMKWYEGIIFAFPYPYPPNFVLGNQDRKSIEQ